VLKAYCVNVDMLSADGEEFVMLPSVEGGSIDGNHSDEVLQYSAKSAVISAVRGKKLNRTNDSTNFMYSDKVTKYCSIVRKVLSLVLFGSKVTHYITKVLCHYDSWYSDAVALAVEEGNNEKEQALLLGGNI